MNFISKILKKPSSKQDIRNRNRYRNSREREEECIEVELDVEEAKRPEVPQFIDGAKSYNEGTIALAAVDYAAADDNDAADNDEFLEEGTVDDFELGEEAGTLYFRQQRELQTQQRPQIQDRKIRNPTAAKIPFTNSNHQSSTYDPNQFIPETFVQFSQRIPHTYSTSYMSHEFDAQTGFPRPQSGYIVEVDPMHVESGLFPDPQTVYNEPAYNYQQFMHHGPVDHLYYLNASMSTPAIPLHPTAYNYLADVEMHEFHQLVADGVPEAEAIRIVQYNRTIYPSEDIRPTHYDEEEQVYRIILHESIEEEKRRKERLRLQRNMQQPIPEYHNYVGLSTEEALTIALQESHDEFEKIKRSQSTPASLSRSAPLSPTTSHSPISLSLDIERANEDALRQAILLSLQESEANSRVNSHSVPNHAPRQSMQYSSVNNNPPSSITVPAVRNPSHLSSRSPDYHHLQDKYHNQRQQLVIQPTAYHYERSVVPDESVPSPLSREHPRPSTRQNMMNSIPPPRAQHQQIHYGNHSQVQYDFQTHHAYTQQAPSTSDSKSEVMSRLFPTVGEESVNEIDETEVHCDKISQINGPVDSLRSRSADSHLSEKCPKTLKPFQSMLSIASAASDNDPQLERAVIVNIARSHNNKNYESNREGMTQAMRRNNASMTTRPGPSRQFTAPKSLAMNDGGNHQEHN